MFPPHQVPVQASYREYAHPNGEAFSPIGGGAKLLFILISVLSCLAFAGCVVGFVIAAVSAGPSGQPDEAWSLVAAIAFCTSISSIYPLAFTGAYWVYRAWSWLPADQRYAGNWKSWISPGQAALFLLIPYFNFYWMFVINLGLCDALDRLRVVYPTREQAPRGLALAAGVCQLLIPLPVGAILWIVYMAKMERLTQQIGVVASRGPVAAMR